MDRQQKPEAQLVRQSDSNTTSVVKGLLNVARVVMGATAALALLAMASSEDGISVTEIGLTIGFLISGYVASRWEL